MAIRLIVCLLLLSTHVVGAQSFSIQKENQQAVSIQFKADSFDGIKIHKAKSYMKGRVEKNANLLTFYPIIPFTPGQKYEVWASGAILFSFSAEATSTRPKLFRMHPQNSIIPSNFLKFYLEFDQPMGEINPYQKIKLFKQQEEIDHAILNLDPPLWNEDYTVLTVWLEPGRIKRGLGPNERRGTILEAGDSLEVQVSPFYSKKGMLSPSIFTRKFAVGIRDEKRPSVKEWQLGIPKAESIEPLRVILSEPMDYFTLMNDLMIRKNGSKLEGSFFLEKGNILRFQPSTNWKPGPYQLRIKSSAEDLAGNNFNRLFDEDLSQKSTVSSKEFETFEFLIK